MPYLCWMYNDDIQQECVGINTCAADMLNVLPTGENQILLIAHNADYDCKLILEDLGNVKPIVKGGRFLQIKAAYYNPIKRNRMKITIKDNYKLIPMVLEEFGKCFKLAVSKKNMPYNTYTYGNVSMGAASTQSALDVFSDSDKQPFLYNLEEWSCILGIGVGNQMFDFIKCSSICCKMDC